MCITASIERRCAIRVASRQAVQVLQKEPSLVDEVLDLEVVVRRRKSGLPILDDLCAIMF
jgi:hypothetical protein